MIAVEINDLSFKYPTSSDWVLRNVNLSIEEGEFLAITGPSGAGKTTLCTCLNGIIPNTTNGDYYGRVSVFGKNAASNDVFEMSKMVGITFQEPEAQLFGLTVEEEIAFGPENYGIPNPELEERVDHSLDLLRLRELRYRSPYNLSGGQKQRVALASVLALRPKLLVLDEPFTELDPLGKAEVSDAIEDLKEKFKVTIVLVEHEAEEIARHADRVVLLSSGQKMLDLPTKEFFNRIDTIHLNGVRSPQVTEFFNELKGSGLWEGVLPIAFDEGVGLLTGRLNGRPMQVDATENGGQAVGKELIRFDDVSYTYPDGTRALSNVSLTIGRGEFVGLVGQNGSGKTTLARMSVGLVRPTDGNFFLDGKDTKRLSTATIARKVGYLFQNPDHQIFSPTIFDEVAFGPRNLGLSQNEVQSRVEDALARVGLSDRKDSHPLFSSRGERQRIALASELSIGPELLILDEPTTGQDWTNNMRILDLAEELNRAGTTIIMISHNMQFIAERTRRVVVMKDGSIILDGPVREVFSDDKRLSEAFIRPPQITRLGLALSSKTQGRAALRFQDLVDAFRRAIQN